MNHETLIAHAEVVASPAIGDLSEHSANYNSLMGGYFAQRLLGAKMAPSGDDTEGAQAYCDGWHLQHQAEIGLDEGTYHQLYADVQKDDTEYGRWKLAGWENSALMGELFWIANDVEDELANEWFMKSFYAVYDDVCAEWYYGYTDECDVKDPTEAMQAVVGNYKSSHELWRTVHPDSPSTDAPDFYREREMQLVYPPEADDAENVRAYTEGWGLRTLAEWELTKLQRTVLHGELSRDCSEHGVWVLAGWENKDYASQWFMKNRPSDAGVIARHWAREFEGLDPLEIYGTRHASAQGERDMRARIDEFKEACGYSKSGASDVAEAAPRRGMTR
jgi:hypothetical protein